MTREKIAAVLVGIIAALLVATLAVRRYAVPDPWKPYVVAVQEYMIAGVRHDSGALAQHSAAAQPVVWVLNAAERRPAMLAAWARELTRGAGERRGDTVVLGIWFNSVEGCAYSNSVSALLLDHSAAPKLLALSSPCIDDRRPPSLDSEGGS
jgi:hypothetical protein